MTVTCNVARCGFFDRGFCRQKTLNIRDGNCGFLFNKRDRSFNIDSSMPVKTVYKESLTIEEGEIRDINDGTGIVRDDNEISVNDN